MITFCKWAMKHEHFLLSWAPEAWRETLRKSTNAPITFTVIRPDDPLLVGYGLAWMMMTVITPLPHLATLRLRLKCNDYSPPPELEEKQSSVLKDSLWLHHFASPKSSWPFEKISFNFFAKLWIPLEVWSARKLDRIWIYARGCMNSNQSTIQYKARIRINSSRPLAALLCYHT